jgi:hypothetical protein
MVPWGAYLPINKPKIKVLPTYSTNRIVLNVAMIYVNFANFVLKLLNLNKIPMSFHNSFYSYVKHAFQKMSG